MKQSTSRALEIIGGLLLWGTLLWALIQMFKGVIMGIWSGA